MLAAGRLPEFSREPQLGVEVTGHDNTPLADPYAELN